MTKIHFFSQWQTIGNSMDTLEHLLMIIFLKSLKHTGGGEITSLVFDWTAIYCIDIMKQSNDQDNNHATAKQCLQWLYLQPAQSVLYVRFGTRSSMFNSHITTRLEGSGKLFLSELGNFVVVSQGFNPSMVPWESAVDAFFLDKNLVVDQNGV